MTTPLHSSDLGDADAALDRIEDGIFAVDADWRLTYLTPQAAAILDVSEDDPIGDPLGAVVDLPADVDLLDRLRSAADGETDAAFETAVPTQDRPVVVRAYPAEDGLTVSLVPRPGEEPTADTSEDAAGDAAVDGQYLSDAALDRLVETSPLTTLILDGDRNITHANRRAVEELDLEEGGGSYEVGGLDVYDADGTYLEPAERPYVRVFETGEAVSQWEGQIDLPDGRREWVLINAAPLDPQSDTVDRVLLTAENITHERVEHRQIEQERDTLASELEALFDRITDAMFAVDEDFRVTVVNDKAAELMEVDPDAVRGERLWDLFPAAEDSTFGEQYHRAMDEQVAVSFVEQFEPLGTTFEVSVYPSESGISVYFRDVTERREREQQLDRYRRIVEAVDHGVYVVEDGEFLMVNEAYEALTGYDRDDLIGSSVEMVVDADTAERAAELREEMAEGDRDEATLETTLQTADGEEVPAAGTFSLLPTDDGIRGIGVIRDISDRVRREQKLEEQRDRLLEQRENLERLVDINGLAQEISQTALEADSRMAVEDAVVELLADSSHYDVAWIGEVGTDPEETNYRAGAGRPTQDLSALVDAVTTDTPGLVQPEVAQRRSSVQVRQNVANDPADPRRDAFDRYDLTSSISLPLTHESENFGVLTIDTDRSDAFTGTERVVLARMAETVAFALGSVEYRQRFHTLIDEVEEYAIFMLDAEGRVQTWNRGARRIKGYTEAEIVGQHISTFYTDEACEAGRPEANLAAAAAEGKTEDTGWRVTADGERFWANVTISAIEEDGEVVGYTKVTRDMTTRREHELQQERLLRVNTVIREINQALVAADSHEEIEHSICGLLANTEPYVFAWYGEASGRDAPDLEVEEWAGAEGGYLDEVRDSLTSQDGGPTSRALATNEVAVCQDVETDETFEPWREAALERGFRSAMAVPVSFGQAQYGVLGVYADEPDAFGEDEQAVFDELGETIGHAKNAIYRKEGLVSETVTQLSLTVQVGDAVGFDLSPTTADARFVLDDTVTSADGTLLHFVTAEGHDEADLDALVEASQTITDCRRLGDDSDRYVLEQEQSELVEAVSTYGGRVTEFDLDDQGADIVVELPQRVDVAEFLGIIQEDYPDVELTAQRTVERDTPSGEELRNTVLAELTEKQLTAIETAYFSGYFEWPRASDGESVADSLNISPSTFHQHLRSGERKVLGELLEEE
ncbi:PAS domain S-box protein [Halobacteriales archaeon Cl-PHB]